jgi:1,2-diacylglycerol 3-beta-galactosyltransferase
MQPQANLPHIIFLFSDTGGGHRSAAEALIEALHLEFPGQLTAEMLDIFRQYMPPPLKSFPEMYPPLARLPDVQRLLAICTPLYPPATG